MKVIKVDSEQRLHWVDEADPVMNDSQVVVDIVGAGVNRADLLQRAGKYPPPEGCPEWMGLEISGVVSAVGKNVGRWKVGDEVCGLLGGGGYAEKVVMSPDMLMPVPSGVSLLEAASLPEVYATSYLNLVMEAGLKPGDTVFVQAGASGLGMAAVQLAKALGAGKVISTVGSDDKINPVQKLGADIVVNRKSGDLGAVLDCNPVDIALDCAGGDALAECIEKMARGGRWILVSTLGGITANIKLRPVLTKGLRLIGSTLRSRPPAKKAEILAALVSSVWPLFAEGKIRPTVCGIYPIEQAEEAHAVLQSSKNLGKVILKVR